VQRPGFSSYVAWCRMQYPAPLSRRCRWHGLSTSQPDQLHPKQQPDINPLPPVKRPARIFSGCKKHQQKGLNALPAKHMLHMKSVLLEQVWCLRRLSAFLLPLLGTAAPAQLQASPRAGPDHAALICRFKVSGGDPVPRAEEALLCTEGWRAGREQSSSCARGRGGHMPGICGRSSAWQRHQLDGPEAWPHTCAAVQGSPPGHPTLGAHLSIPPEEPT